MQNAKYKIELTTILRISSGTFLLALHSACAEECEKITGALHTRDFFCTAEVRYFAQQRFFGTPEISFILHIRDFLSCTSEIFLHSRDWLFCKTEIFLSCASEIFLHSRDSLCCKTEIFLSCTSEIFFAKQRFFERADIDHNVVEFRKMKKC